MRQLTTEVKILIFKTLAISKVVHLALVKDLPSSAIAQLEKKQFIWKSRKPKLTIKRCGYFLQNNKST